MQEFTDKAAPYQIPFECYGLQMRLCTNSQELLERAEPLLPPGWKRVPRSDAQKRVGLMAEEDGIYAIYNDAVCTHDAPGEEYALMMLEHQLAVHIAIDAPEFTAVHAGVVAHGDRAIVIPGYSFNGKTTLVRALVEAGAVYYSDEYAMFDQDGLVHPYARRLSFRPPDGVPVELPVEDLGGVAGTEPLRVGLVAVAHYRVDGEWNPRTLSQSAGALAMLEHAIATQLRPAQTLQTLRKAVEGATVLEGERGEAQELAGELLETLRETRLSA
jgi:hypothetical protein